MYFHSVCERGFWPLQFHLVLFYSIENVLNSLYFGRWGCKLIYTVYIYINIYTEHTPYVCISACYTSLSLSLSLSLSSCSKSVIWGIGAALWVPFFDMFCGGKWGCSYFYIPNLRCHIVFFMTRSIHHNSQRKALNK